MPLCASSNRPFLRSSANRISSEKLAGRIADRRAVYENNAVDDYVECAVRLDCDADFRRAVEENIATVLNDARRQTDAIARDMEFVLPNSSSSLEV